VDGADVTFDQLHKQWIPRPAGVELAGDAFARHLRSICSNCWGAGEEHVQSKCLFGATTYRKADPKISAFYLAWYNSRLPAPINFDQFWGFDVNDVP
jgi:hypothetical protein